MESGKMVQVNLFVGRNRDAEAGSESVDAAREGRGGVRWARSTDTCMHQGAWDSQPGGKLRKGPGSPRPCADLGRGGEGARRVRSRAHTQLGRLAAGQKLTQPVKELYAHENK